jgi:biofilm protein TabA
MFYGIAAEWQRDKICLPAAFDKALAFLEGKDLASLPNGKYEIDGDMIFALAQGPSTEPENARRFEAHAKYFDIHLLISGEEKQLYAANNNDATVTEDALAERDAAFYTRPAACNAVVLAPMAYAVYAPRELHAPNCDASIPGCKLKKIVFKIHKDAI